MLVSLISCMCFYNAYAENNYSYKSECPSPAGGAYISQNVDAWQFYKCECVSYVAYRLNSVAPINFNNSYGGVGWSDAKNWGAVAIGLGIRVNSNPLPGDVAYWTGEDYGHVAFVEGVNHNEYGDVVSIDVTEYNYSPEYSYNSRSINKSTPTGSPSGYPNGFIHFLDMEYEGVACSPYGNDKKLCWSYENGNIDCSSGTGHIIDDSENFWCTFADMSYCSGVSEQTTNSTVGGRGGGIAELLSGPGYQTPATELPDPGLPDFVLDELQLADSSGNEKYLFLPTDTIQMHSWSENIGDADWAKFPDEDEADDIYVKFYLSNGYKEDDHDGEDAWDSVGVDDQQIKKGNLDVGDEKHEWDILNLATYDNGNPIAPGIYNIVACVDRKYDHDNGDGEVPEKHKSNNCSTEAVFTVLEPNHVPEGYLDSASCDNIAGWTRDANTTNPINVHFYADGTSDTGTFVGTTLANEYRGDLPFDDNYHGFVVATPEVLKDGNSHTIYAYGIDDQGGTNPLLSNSPKTISNCYDFIIRADVDHDGVLGIDDFMMTFNVAIGYDQTSQGWVDTPTTGDVNCDGQVTTTDSMLISRKVYGQDMRGTAWCDEDFPEIRADVNQDGLMNTTDALLTNLKVNGQDMSQTAWVESPSTGDVNCDLTVNAADVDLLMQNSLGFDMSQTAWCAEN